MTPPQPVALQSEQRNIFRLRLPLPFFAQRFAAAYLLLPGLFLLPAELAERIAFALEADVFVFLWIVVGVRMVARGRFHSAARPAAPLMDRRIP